MHDPGAESLIRNAGKTGWVIAAAKVNPPDVNSDYSALTNNGFGVIVRLNNGYGSDGTLPNSSQYDVFAQQCASFVTASRGARIWIIGNETNLAGERPGNTGANDGEVITPDKYAQCFGKCRKAIKQLVGHADDWVIPAAPAPWNNQTTYPGNPSGDWVKYFQDLLTQIMLLNAKPDALALHTYTHGLSPSFITSEVKMDAPFANYHKHFRAYRDFLGVVPAALKTLPVLITEAQPADPDWWRNQNVGWVQAAYKEINDWNATAANQAIQALCLFRWFTGDVRWSISDKAAVQDDFRTALQTNYRTRWTSVPITPTDPGVAALQAARQVPWMPINTESALYKFAQARNLGFPQTDEFEFTFNNQAYIAQVYNLGIVYVKKGDWGNCKFANKV